TFLKQVCNRLVYSCVTEHIFMVTSGGGKTATHYNIRTRACRRVYGKGKGKKEREKNGEGTLERGVKCVWCG
ncbi:hypothetical protein NSB26_10865, partial [Phocaeicola sartorii]|uniref:hypothetical protein n=1 Tax=Phocaeicola sartorii TaxID=671267 RepID=UPI00214AADFA